MTHDEPAPDSLDAAIADYLRRVDAEEAPDRAAFLAAHPSHADGLRSFFRDQDRFEPIVPMKSVDPNSTLAPSDAHGTTRVVRYFGDYELLEEIARGGMGVVYRARQVSLNRVVALKMILAGNLANAADVQRFRAEAEAAANLDHPNILPIYEVGEHEGQHYFSMKLIEGGNLSAVVKKRFASEVTESTESRKGNSSVYSGTSVAKLLSTIARAVHYAHQRGILHRDLKPANILLDAEDTPYVTDFGLAKRVQGDSGLTQSGAIVGTPSYMAPEQARAEKQLSTAVDVYSLGAILYEALAGRPPFHAPTPLDTILQVLERQPDRPIGCDRDLATVALKCLEKVPTKRYGSAAALADELDRWRRGEPILARPVSTAERARRWCHRNPVVAGLSAGLALLFVAGFITVTLLYFRADALRMQADRERDNARGRLVRNYVSNGIRHQDENDYFGALPWFVEALALDELDPDRAVVHRIRLGLLERLCPRLVHQWAGENHATHAEFSPDGQRVVTAGGTASTGSAHVWDVTTGRPIGPPLRHTFRVDRATFSPDGRHVVTICSDVARVWDTATGQPVTPADKEQAIRATRVEFTPEGRYLVTHFEIDVFHGILRGDARVWDPNTGKPLSPPLKHGDDGHVAHVAISPNGQHLLTVGNDQTARLWEIPTGRPVGDPWKHSANPSWAAFRPDGRAALTITGEQFHRTAVRATGVQFQLWSVPSGQPLAPPRGQAPKLAWFISGGQELQTLDGDGGLRRWDANNGNALLEFAPRTRLLGQTAQISPDALILAAEDGGRRSGLIDTVRDNYFGPVLPREDLQSVRFSPNSAQMVVTGHRHGTRLWDLVAPTRSSERIIWNGELFRAEYSPSSRFVLLGSRDAVQVWDSQQRQTVGPLRRSAIRGSSPGYQFSPDGTAFANSDGNAVRVWDVATGSPRTPPFVHDQAIDAIAYSPDGAVLAVAAGRSIHRWNLATGQSTNQPIAGDVGASHLCFSGDGRRLLSGGSGNVLQWWDAVSGEKLGPAHHLDVNSVTRSPDGMRILTTSVDEGQIWDATTGDRIGPPLRSANQCGAFSPDGQRVVTRGPHYTACVWDVASGAPLTPPLNCDGPVWSVAFSPDGRLVVTGMQNTSQLWDARTGEPVGPRLAGFGPTFDGDGRRLMTIVGGYGESYDLSPCQRNLDDWRQRAMLLALRRIDPTGGYVPVESEELARIWDALSGSEPTAQPAVRQRLWHRTRAEDVGAFDRPSPSHRPDDRDRHELHGGLWHLDRLLALAPDDPMNWHGRARTHARLGHWTEATADYTQAIERGRTEADLFAERGRALAALQRWRESAADFTRSIDRGGDPHRLRHALALCLVASGDLVAYRRLCSENLARLTPEPADRAECLAIARLCLIGPGAAPDLARVVVWLERDLAAGGEHELVLGGLLVRQEKHQAALDMLKKFPDYKQGSTPEIWFWNAFAQRRLGQTERARESLQKGDKMLDWALAHDEPWTAALERSLLRQEVEAETRLERDPK